MGGYEQLLRGEPFRAKFRSSWEKPEPLVPGKETDIDFTMPDLYHTFRPRSSHHGSGAKLVVPAHRTAIRRLSRTFPTQSRRISRRPPSRSSTRKTQLQGWRYSFCRNRNREARKAAREPMRIL